MRKKKGELIMDLERIKTNIKFAVKSKGLKLGDVEKRAGYSPGYVSRKGKGIPLPLLYFVSKETGYTIDRLVNDDFKIDRYQKLFYLLLKISELKEEIEKLEKEIKVLEWR
jgi:transcriptional regulator with XRE-family HTH domain